MSAPLGRGDQGSHFQTQSSESGSTVDQPELPHEQVKLYQDLLKFLSQQPESTGEARQSLWKLEFDAFQQAISALRTLKEIHALKTKECKILAVKGDTFWKAFYPALYQLDEQLGKAFWMVQDISHRTGSFLP